MRPGVSQFSLGNAVLCVEIARPVTDADYKATWLAMAQSWLGLADQADKNTQAVTATVTSDLRAFQSEIRLVRLEAPTTMECGEVTCLSCGGPLPAREGAFLMKYFLVGPQSKVRDERNRPPQLAAAIIEAKNS